MVIRQSFQFVTDAVQVVGNDSLKSSQRADNVPLEIADDSRTSTIFVFPSAGPIRNCQNPYKAFHHI